MQWAEFALLRRSLNQRIGRTGVPAALLMKLGGAAVAAALVAWILKPALGPRHPLLAAALILVPYGLIYVGIAYGWGVLEARAVVGRLGRIAGQSTH